MEKKNLKAKRTQKKLDEKGNEVYQLCTEAKKVWEEYRRSDCTKEKKKELTKQLYELIKGNVKNLIYAHDTVRVIETLLAVAEEEYRSAIFEELKPELHKLCKNKYSKFFVLKFLRYGTKKEKDAVIESFKGHIIEFMKHKVLFFLAY